MWNIITVDSFIIFAKDDYKYSVEHNIEDYRKTYQWSETCQRSVPVAIRCFLESDDYESFLRNVFSLKCDMDTLCAIGGGIAEEFYHGTGLDNDYLLGHYLNRQLYREVRENYFPITLEQLLSKIPTYKYEIIYFKDYTLPFTSSKIKQDFDVDIHDNTHVKLLLQLKEGVNN